MKVLVTGAAGFIGRNVQAELGRTPDDYTLLCADVDTPDETLREYAATCDFVIHLAGVNRPQNESEFRTGNTDFTVYLLSLLEARGGVPIAMTSSTQAALDNPYGRSKKAAEDAVLEYGRRTGAAVYVFRLPNVFGKWCRPNYNSAVATFCHNIARDLPVTVTDPKRLMTLVYIDDVLDLLKSAMAGQPIPGDDGRCPVPVTHDILLGDIVERLRAFHEQRKNLTIPDLSDALNKALYSTFLSYLPTDAFSYPLVAHSDPRGAFAEFFRNKEAGQFSVSTTVPGITRGNHWHHTKVEKFLVVSGKASLRFRHIQSDEVIEYIVTGEEPTVVDIPPGYTHLIENVGDDTLVTLIWANELFDPERPDTYYLEV